MSHEPKLGYLPIFKSPLLSDNERSSLTHHASHDFVSDHSQHGKAMHHHEESRDDEYSQDGHNDEYLNDRPAFRRHAEATNAELFYDLFFVANLTVFTNIHELNDIKPLKQFIGFFAIIWMTWYQVSLYDVRFGSDSVVDRITKAVQFGVMVGFAVIGPRFNVGTPPTGNASGELPHWETFRALCIVLMVSRLVLATQYIQALFFVRKFSKVKTPLAIIAGTYVVAALVYLGLFFTFSAKGNQTYVVWYIVALSETLIATAVSSLWRIISFKGTHLVQRMSLLTLIFLGEGIIIAAKKTQLIFGTSIFGATPANIGNVISCILILYFLYMLYFDWIEEEHFGSIRQQIWAFLHFPLHLAIVVGTEGSGQVLSWTAATESINRLADQVENFPFNGTDKVYKAATSSLKHVAKAIEKKAIKGLTYSSLAKYNNATFVIDTKLSSMPNITDPTERAESVFKIFVPLFEMTYDIAGFTPPHNESSTEDPWFMELDQLYDSAQDQFQKQYQVFTMTFVYFFVAIGLVVMIVGLIGMLSRTDKNAVQWTRLSMHLLIGMTICLLSTIAVGYQKINSPLERYASGPWILPTTTLLLFLTIVLNNIKLKLPQFPRRRGTRLHFGHGGT